ncbi:TPA: hypothetical protein JAN03_18495 [Citrobacter freundii]|nr:hypothetical protein [Citrobacter freundii]
MNVVTGVQTLDNTDGTLLAGQSLSITNAGTLTNIRGELAAGGTLSLGGAALNLVNTTGVVKAGERVVVQSDRPGVGVSASRPASMPVREKRKAMAPRIPKPRWMRATI